MTLNVAVATAVADCRVVRSRRPTLVEPEFWDRPDLAKPLAERDVAALFLALQHARYSQRSIARLTGQSQSEISEILRGRRVRMIHVLERIADGLGIPRERMGLAETKPAQDALDAQEGCPSPPPFPEPKVPDVAPVAPPWRSPSSPPSDRTGQLTVLAPVFRWTGADIRLLREAMRMSIRGFAAYLGVSDRMVSKWEAGGADITPRPVNQAALDTCLARAGAEAQARFAGWPTQTREHASLMAARRWVAHLVLDVPNHAAAIAIAQQIAEPAAHLPQLVSCETTISPEDRQGHRYRVFSHRPDQSSHDPS